MAATAAFLCVFAILFTSAAAQLRECPTPPATPQDRRTNKDFLRIVSWNAKWLFYFGGTGTIKCPSVDCGWETSEAALDHVKDVAAQLAKMDGDVVVLLEVESCETLDLLMQNMPSNHRYARYIVRGKDTYTGQQIGLLTRIDPMVALTRTESKVSYPVPGSTCKNQDTGTYGASKHFFTKLSLGDFNLVVSGIHYLSQPTNTQRCTQREAQASVVRNHLDTYWNPDNEYLAVMGDFNDFEDQFLDSSSSVPITQTLKIQRTQSRATLLNVARNITQPQRYTCWYDRNSNCIDGGGSERSMIDHMLVSPNLHERMVASSIGHLFVPTCGYGSDHWPVIADFDLSDKPNLATNTIARDGNGNEITASASRADGGEPDQESESYYDGGYYYNGEEEDDDDDDDDDGNDDEKPEDENSDSQQVGTTVGIAVGCASAAGILGFTGYKWNARRKSQAAGSIGMQNLGGQQTQLYI